MQAISSGGALGRFDVVQELSPAAGNRLLLGRSEKNELSIIEVLTTAPIAADVASLLSRQAALASRLSDGAVLKTREILLEKDFAAIVSEYVPGVVLQRLLRFASGRGVRLPDQAGWYIVERVLVALAHAHGQADGDGARAPLVHGNVSPSAVLVGWDGTTKLGDFGFARMRATVNPQATLGEPAEGIALPIMAPEQARGEVPTERADVFHAALLALRVATGRTPYARFRESATERILAMSEGDVTKLGRTRTDLPKELRAAFDSALAADPAARTITARELLEVVRAHADVAAGREALATLVGRWREQLETTVTPWERRASTPDDAWGPDTDLHEGALALATPDDRPSNSALVSGGAPDEPWKKDALPKEETPLVATDPRESQSRLGATALSALTIPPLPPVRLSLPPTLELTDEQPVEAPPPPPPEREFFSGPRAAVFVALGLVLLVAAAVVLTRWIMAPA